MINIENISFDHCIKCTVCTIYCPVARVTPRYPGPKQSGPDTERLRIKNPELLDASLYFCNNCKRCEIACPSDVKIADIIQNAKWKYTRNKIRLRDLILSRTDLTGRIATTFGSAVNFFTRLPWVRFLLGLFLKISPQTTFPQYATGTFHRRNRKMLRGRLSYTQEVVYFHGCYVNYNDHGLGEDVLSVLNALNVGVHMVDEKCCGVPLIANGFIAKAKKNARFNIDSLRKAVKGKDLKIVSASSSCTFALKYEYRNILEMDNSAIADKTEYITKFIYHRLEEGKLPSLYSIDRTVVYHGPCHLERIGGVVFTLAMLRKIPGLEILTPPTECCGISGTYGFKNEYYHIAREVGTRLFEQINMLKPDLVVTDCETCKMQIEMNTPYKVLHPITLLARSIHKNQGGWQ